MRAVRVICITIIILFVLNKIIQISTLPPGQLAYILDPSNPSVIGVLFVISMMVLSLTYLRTGKAGSGTVEAKDKERVSTSPREPQSQASSPSSFAATNNESEAWYCDACDAEISVDDKICPNCGANVSEVIDQNRAERIKN